MKKVLLIMIGVIAFSAVGAMAMQPINFLIELNKITLNKTDINSTGYYDLSVNDSSYVGGYPASYFCPLNATACLTGALGEPNWEGNYSLVAFKNPANISNSTLYWDNLVAPLVEWTNTFNSTYDAKVSDNVSWNQTLADNLYYSITNLFGFYNSTTLPYFINNTFNASYLTSESQFNGNWTYLNGKPNSTANASTDSLLAWFYNRTNPYEFYNSTTIPYYSVANESSTTCSAGSFISAISNSTGIETCTMESEPMWNGNATTVLNWNKTYADTLYNPISTPANTSNNTLFCNGLACLANSSLNTFNTSYNAQLGHNTTTEVQAAMNNTNTQFNITLTYINDSKIYFGTQHQYCIFYNSTLMALVLTNVC